MKVGDVLDEPADALLSTANPWLAMSGGVNGAILQRGNDGIAEELRRHLSEHGLRTVPQGSVVRASAGNLKARVLLPCVAVNAFYESSPEVIRSTVDRALRMAAVEGARTVAMPMLATGFGPLRAEDFASGVAALSGPYGSVETLVIVVRKEEERDAIRRVIPTPSA